ncbi:uncharacterized protein LOC114804747 isoform X2 [Zeugodacus cucurbitae]|uniref:uncharacterized protein LOC114804747 isoform X2 n=1 Tax=Zeugodacus cucurbitae TaxID=28588 RepID=UPI0023D9522E|nr:uncharacterized protein LOC114804747 isoform X2 [Zeugodacus cucurbitae]
MTTDDEERVCLRSEEERSMDDKLVCDEVHLRTLSQSPLALQCQQQRRQSNQSTQSTTKTITPIQRRRCSGGNAITISNEFELPGPPLAQHELLDDDGDDDPKCQRISVKNPTTISLTLDITDNGDSGVGGDDETDCGLSNPAVQTEDNDGVIIAETHNEDLIDSSILRVKHLPNMFKIPRLPGDGAHSVDDQRTAKSCPSATPSIHTHCRAENEPRTKKTHRKLQHIWQDDQLCSEEERSVDDKLVCDEVHLRTLSESPLALQRKQQRRQSNQSIQSTTKTITPIQRRRCSGGNVITISNEFELPRPPLAHHELLDDDGDDDPKCQRVSVKNPTTISLPLDITDNGDSGVGGDDETDCGLSNAAAQTEDNEAFVIAETHNEDIMDSNALRVKVVTIAHKHSSVGTVQYVEDTLSGD